TLFRVRGRKHLKITTARHRRDPAPQRLEHEVMHAVLDLVDEQGRPVLCGCSRAELEASLKAFAHHADGKQGSPVIEANEQLAEAVRREKLDTSDMGVDLA